MSGKGMVHLVPVNQNTHKNLQCTGSILENEYRLCLLQRRRRIRMCMKKFSNLSEKNKKAILFQYVQDFEIGTLHVFLNGFPGFDICG